MAQTPTIRMIIVSQEANSVLVMVKPNSVKDRFGRDRDLGEYHSGDGQDDAGSRARR